MKNLTNREEIKKIDPQDTFGTTEIMLDQLEAAWNQVKALDIPKIEDISNIVFCGMGASIYGALVVQSLLGSKFPYPTETVTDYHLPEYVNEHTLVVLTSYSGSTEEVLSCAYEAKEKGCKMLVLTKGGKLGDFAKEHSVSSYIFDGKLNPASVPRLGNGYSILGLIGLLSQSGVISIDEDGIVNAIARVIEYFERLKSEAMKDSEKLVGKIPIVITAEHLSGNAQILRNQFNETSKAFSAYYLVPDLNHHLMEGLAFPENAELYFILFQTKNYSEKIYKRIELTRKVIDQNKRMAQVIQLDGKSVYEDFVSMLMYGSFLTLFLGLRYNQNPAINPWVDWFKEELAK